jgi:hypothetical protein
MASIVCTKCGKEMDEGNFYTYKNGDKPSLCKKCMTMHIDNFDPDTFTYLLKEMDVPYVPSEWNALRDKAFAKDPYKMNGMSVFGKYLSKMKLKQWKDYSWADTESFLEKEKKTEAILKEKREAQDRELAAAFAAGTITEAEYKTYTSTASQNKEIAGTAPKDVIGADNRYNEGNFLSEEEVNPAQSLTQEDKMYLAMKWGRLYSPNDWIALEKDYDEMSKSFDIQDADTINTLILLCKTNLKANQAIDAGDIDGFQKLARVQESLRKSAKFTAAQNKEKKSDYVDSVGELVAMCEREGGFIPKYVTDIPQDIVDITLKDMNNYLHKLVTQDLGFGQQIEDSLKKIQIQKEVNSQEDDLPIEDGDDVLEMQNKDFIKFFEEMDSQKETDEKMLMKGE